MPSLERSLGPMRWKPPDEHDREIRRWMDSKGWKVTGTHYDFSRELYAWRHELSGGKSPTLWISQKVLEDFPAFIVIHHLEELRVAQAIRARPEARLVVAQNGSMVTLEEILPPK